jgi:protein PhnA
MSIEASLSERSANCCELCSATHELSVYEVPPAEPHADKCIYICVTCKNQIEQNSELDHNHWRCLNDSMWSQVAAVQVVAYRMLHRLAPTQGWAQDLLDMLYLEDEVKAWADKGISAHDNDTAPTVDSNGASLQPGDNVTLIKDLVVKGANFTAKRGTMVRNISLTDNPEHIEGRVNGTRIVLVAAYLKKA